MNIGSYNDEEVAEIIIIARDTGNISILKSAVSEGLKRGLVKKCKKCTCMMLQEDFDLHNCGEDKQ